MKSSVVSDELSVRPRVVCVRMSAHGDVLMMGRSLSRLRAAGAEPILVTSAASVDAAQCLRALRSIWTCDDGKWTFWERDEASGSWSEQPMQIQAIAMVLDFQVTGRSARALQGLKHIFPMPMPRVLRVQKDRLGRLVMMARARFRGQSGQTGVSGRGDPGVGVSTILATGAGVGARGGFRVALRYDDLVSQCLVALGSSDAADSDSDSASVTLVTGTKDPAKDTAKDSAKALLQSVGPCAFPAFDCVVFAGASLPLKAWPKANCLALVERLRSAGLSVALAGGPAEADLASSVAARCPGAVALAGALDLAQTIDLIARARCVVTTDSFPGHVRSLSGGPTLVLFGATSPSLGFVPMGEGVQVATLDLGCSPCTRHGRGSCRFGNHACMAGLSGGAVADWVMMVLGRCPAG